MKNRFARLAIILLIAALAMGAIKNFIDLYDVRLTRATAPESIASALRGMKILFLSDIHVRSIGIREKAVLSIVLRERPDYILISGDLMPYGGPIEPSIEFLKMLKPGRAGYAVLGDAEYREGIRNCLYCHAKGSWSVRTDLPVKVLRDEGVTLEGLGGEQVELWCSDAQPGRRDFSWTSRFRSDRPAIAMVHFPYQFPFLAEAGASLVLAGDTHGGQAWAPRPFYRLLMEKVELPYLSGRFESHGSTMWVNKGLGWSIFPIRLGVKPEVILFDFTENAPGNAKAARS
jgi:uncharacterized protein